MPTKVLVTACICTHNRPQYTRNCLAGLAKQTAQGTDWEVVVVDSCSDKPVAEELARLTELHPTIMLVRVSQPGLSLARNVAAARARGEYIAYIDDDAVPELDWIDQIRRAIARAPSPPGLIGGRILPVWEKELPAWWPTQLRATLSLIEFCGRGEYRSGALPAGVEPYGANMIVRRSALLQAGGFNERVGRVGDVLLSGEEVQLAWRLQDQGYSVRYESEIVVRHHIQADRLDPAWLLTRLYWQGASNVIIRRLSGEGRLVWYETLRRLLVCLVLIPTRVIPKGSTLLFSWRWRFSYSLGFLRAALGRIG